jgi:hypothetical protein
MEVRPRFVLPESYAALRARGVTPGEIRGPRWQRTSRGFYVPAGTPDSPWQRVANAGVRLPGAGAVGTWAAAGLHGVEWCDGFGPDGRTPLPITLYVGQEGHIRGLGCEVSQEPLPPHEVCVRFGLRCTVPLRTSFDGMRLAADLVEAVVFGDMMLALDLVEPGGLRCYVERHPRWRGVRQARAALPLLAGGTRGPWESRLRMVWRLAAGLPPPLVNVPVFTRSGELIGIPDLFDAEAAVAWEFDGGGHRAARQHTADNVREEAFEDAGVHVGRATSLDFADEAVLAARMARARQRGLHRDRRTDAWTLTAPPDPSFSDSPWYPPEVRSALREALLAMDPGPGRTLLS